jgi:hypothetical protein
LRALRGYLARSLVRGGIEKLCCLAAELDRCNRVLLYGVRTVRCLETVET